MKNINKKVTAIVLNYNGYQDTLECVQSLLKVNYPLLDIVIIDNDSTDDSIYNLTTFFEKYSTNFKLPNQKESRTDNKSVKIINSGINGGYGFGNNVGIKYALASGADYVLILNNDTIVKPDFISPLVDAAEEDPVIGIVSSKILYHHDKSKIWSVGGEVTPLLKNVTHYFFNQIDSRQKIPEQLNFISGCMWLIRKDVFLKVGFINEEYFMYVEDVEYCHRVISKGYKLTVIPESQVFHKVGSAGGGRLSPFSIYWKSKNMYKYITTYESGLSGILPLLNIFVVRTFRWLIKFDLVLLKAHVNGLFDGVIGK
jgi:GT2 family glycosyltransferase